MTTSEKRIVERGIRQLFLRVGEQRVAFQKLPERFPSAFLEAVDEVLQRFQRRLDSEHISDEVAPAASLSVSHSAAETKTNNKI